MGIFLFKQKTAYEMRISDWSSDVCSSDLLDVGEVRRGILGLEIAPALMRPARLRHHRNQFGLHHDAAVGPLVLEDRIFQADDRAAHGGIALDDPVERNAVQHFCGALGHMAGVKGEGLALLATDIGTASRREGASTYV